MTDLHNDRVAIISPQHTQVAAVFDSEDQANKSVRKVTSETSVNRDQITVVNPSDQKLSRKLEGPSAPIGKSMWHAHLLLGGAGLVIGLIVAFVLTQFGPALTQQNPLFTYIALISPGLFIGLFIAGLIGLRPDRTEIINTVRHAVREKRFAIVVNLQKHQSVKDVARVLGKYSGKVVESAK
ncbi:hypothetical protein OCL06_06825 [Alteromonas sp. ASW11-19]|uniref:Riboflavin biosynthesis protein RibA n=1 Tax=Alteromonas salexigens TaxID=2982530 RepID=A0ABT2VLW0_9ALTE|nr:hypothetical protein [Alteromonas salexigens]MCU7554307.1 hypothetical protein [Alteromonas salexigens]